MPGKKPTYKSYASEIGLAIIEVAAKPLVVMLSFLYGRGKINLWYFLALAFLAQSIGSILFIKSSVYDQRKIGNKIHIIRNKTEKNNIYHPPSFVRLSAIMLTLQFLFILGSTIVPPLYKKQKISFFIYSLLFVASFIIGSVPAILFRRKEYAERKSNCQHTLNTLNEQSSNTNRKNLNCYSEILCVCIEIGAKSIIFMLHFLYGINKINDLTFSLIAPAIQFIGSIFFIKNVIYDTKTVNNHLAQIHNKLTSKDNDIEDNSKNDQSTERKHLGVTINMIVLQLVYIVGSVVAPILYKQDKLNFAAYVTISLLSFLIGIVPTVICRRIQKVEDNFICDQILSDIDFAKASPWSINQLQINS